MFNIVFIESLIASSFLFPFGDKKNYRVVMIDER